MKIFHESFHNLSSCKVSAVDVRAVNNDRYLRFEALFVDQITYVINGWENETTIRSEEKIFDAFCWCLIEEMKEIEKNLIEAFFFLTNLR